MNAVAQHSSFYTALVSGLLLPIHESLKGGMHISAEDTVIEIVDPTGNASPPGKSGKIVVTHTATSDFPFVRYRTGDLGALSSFNCRCGRRGLPVLENIQGRSTNFVIASDGSVMHGLALIYVVRNVPGIDAFRIIQESLNLTTLQLVTTRQFDESDLDSMRQGLRARLGPEVVINVERLTHIPKEASGKHRYIVSHASPGMPCTPDAPPISPE